MLQLRFANIPEPHYLDLDPCTMSKTFGRASQQAFDSVLIASVVCIVAYTGWHIVATSQILRHAAQASATNTYRIDEQLRSIDDITPDTRHTIAVVLSSACRFCSMSSAFYRDLIHRYGRTSTQNRSVVQVVALCQESLDSCRSYLDRERLAFDAVVSTTDKGMKLVDTPTLLLLDQSRHVRQVWVGYQDRAGQIAVASVLRSSILMVSQ